MARRGRPPPPPGSLLNLAQELGHYGLIMVLFETPSGFAVLYADGVSLYEPHAMEHIWANFVTKSRANRIMWRKDFQVFQDKSDAVNIETGLLNDQLTRMLLKWWRRRPDQKLAVGKPEYKTIIEATLKIPCLHDEAVVEMMRGLNYLLHSVVPEEKSPKQDECLRTSRGLQLLLHRYGFSDVEPDMVDELIIETACILYDCDGCQKNWSESLRLASGFLEEVSSIDSEDWDILKLATALKMVCYPDEEITFGNPREMFSADELSKLVADAPKYEGSGIIKGAIRRLYDETVFIMEFRTEGQRRLASFVKTAKEAYESRRGEAQAVHVRSPAPTSTSANTPSALGAGNVYDGAGDKVQTGSSTPRATTKPTRTTRANPRYIGPAWTK